MPPDVPDDVPTGAPDDRSIEASRTPDPGGLGAELLGGHDDVIGDDGSLPITGGGAGSAGGRRRLGRTRRGGCLPFLAVVLIVVIAGVVVWAQHDFENPATALGHKIKGAFASDDQDYPGPGAGRVSFQVAVGDSVTTIGENLVTSDVVASVGAFTQAANANAKSDAIQPGTYYLKKKMRASAAVAILVDPDKVVSTTVTVPEGYRAAEIVDLLAQKTKFSKRAFQQVLDHPASLGLPAYAAGRVEGYLFPATYAFPPTATPTSMLTAMVTRFDQAADDDGIVAAAKRLGYTPGQLVTVASMAQAEGRGDDMPKITRVIYNRLSEPTASTAGFLGIDATINYALGRKLGVGLSQADLDVDSPYNTRTHQGLPPGPIDSPGDEALRAAAHPASGNWLYYVTVNLRTGETRFTRSPAQFEAYKQQLQTYCQTSTAC